MNISVVIPNYNGQEGLNILLPELIKNDFQGIYLADDGSKDQSIAYAKNFKKINIIEGKINLGPAGNPNRILQEKGLGELLWFVDSDMEIITRNVSKAAAKLFQDPRIALVGGKILTRAGNSMYWNYGYDPHPLRDRIANYYGQLSNKFKKTKKVHDLIRRRACNYFYGVEIEAGNHQERIVEWVAEVFFFVRTDVLK